MLNVPDGVKEAYKKDGLKKDYEFNIASFHSSGNEITSDGITYTDSICTGDNLDFKSTQKASVKFNMINYSDELLLLSENLKGKEVSINQNLTNCEITEKIYPAVYDNTVNGVHIVSDGKGTVTLKGTATDTVWIHLFSGSVPAFDYHVGGILSVNINGSNITLEITDIYDHYAINYIANDSYQVDSSNCGHAYFTVSISDKAVIDETVTDVVASYTYNESYKIPYGNYIIDSAEKTSDNLIEITAYDYMEKFNNSADDWWNNLTFPMTIKEILISLCTYFGVTYSSSNPTTFTNSDFSVASRTISVKNSTGLDFLAYIQEASFSFFKIDRQTNELKQIVLNNTPVESYALSDYRGDATFSDYSTAIINKVHVHDTDSDVGGIAGIGTNAYQVTGNVFFKNISPSDLSTVASNLLTAIDGFTYTPFTLDACGLFYLDVGDAVSVITPKGKTINSYIFNRSMTGSQMLIDAIETKGSKDRTTVKSVNKVLESLSQRTLEIIADVDEWSTTMINADEDLRTKIAQTAKDLTVEINANSDSISSLTTEMTPLQETLNSYKLRLKVTSTGLQIAIIDSDGNIVSDYTSEYTPKGMRVVHTSDNTATLIAEEDSVTANNLTAKNFLTIDTGDYKSRFQKYNDSNDSNQIGCFWVDSRG